MRAPETTIVPHVEPAARRRHHRPKKKRNNARRAWYRDPRAAIFAGGLSFAAGVALSLIHPTLPELALGVLSLVAALAASAVGYAARPKRDAALGLGLWPLAWALGIGMPLLALAGKAPLAALGAEAAGAATLALGLLRLSRADLGRGVDLVRIDAARKVTVLGAAGDRELPISALAEGDRVRLEPGAEVPVDGTVESGTGFVDEGLLTAARLPAAKKPRDVLLAGSTSSIPSLVMVAGGDVDRAFLTQREKRTSEVLQKIAGYDGRAKALAAVVYATGLVAIAFAAWRLHGDLALLVPYAAALALASATGAPALALSASRLRALDHGRAYGLVVTRIRHLDALGAVRRWQIDPRLLAAPGPVEVTAIGTADAGELLGIAVALLEEDSSPESASIRGEAERMKVEPPQGAALRRGRGVHVGTVQGSRWFLGPLGAVEADQDVRPEPEVQNAVAALKDKGAIVWVIGRKDAGVRAVLGIFVAVDAEVGAAARALRASVMPGLPDTTRQAVARVCGITCDGPPLGEPDATLLMEGTPPPSAGLRLRVLAPRSRSDLEEGASPRIFGAALPELPAALGAVRAALRRGRVVSTILALTPPVIAAALALTRFDDLGPALGAALAVITILTASTVAR